VKAGKCGRRRSRRAGTAAPRRLQNAALQRGEPPSELVSSGSDWVGAGGRGQYSGPIQPPSGARRPRAGVLLASTRREPLRVYEVADADRDRRPSRSQPSSGRVERTRPAARARPDQLRSVKVLADRNRNIAGQVIFGKGGGMR
jgi:hypothetical protein